MYEGKGHCMLGVRSIYGLVDPSIEPSAGWMANRLKQMNSSHEFSTTPAFVRNTGGLGMAEG